jgi:hypothetical protein
MIAFNREIVHLFVALVFQPEQLRLFVHIDIDSRTIALSSVRYHHKNTSILDASDHAVVGQEEYDP